MYEMKNRLEFPRLLHSLSLTGSGVEVGVDKGTFATHMLKFWTCERFYLVDCWENQLRMIAAIAQLEPWWKKVQIVHMFSKEAATLFASNTLDFVYIDANHSYECVFEDLKLWYPKVKIGGVIAGHDYYDEYLRFTPDQPAFRFGVVQAVHDFFANKEPIRVTQETPGYYMNQGDEFVMPSWYAIKALGET